MPDEFGGLAISFEQLLHNLEHLCGCTVIKLSDIGDMRDSDGSAAGALYEVTRENGFRYAHVEVFSYDLPVLPLLIRSISIQLDLPVERILGRRLN